MEIIDGKPYSAIVEEANREKDMEKLKDVKVEHINILSRVKITYKDDEGRLTAIREASTIKKETSHYGPNGYTIKFEESEHVRLRESACAD